MNTDITFLPDIKQRELRTITQLIKSHELPEMIILFGSYARNEWVEEKYDNEHYRYQSDYVLTYLSRIFSGQTNPYANLAFF